MKRVSLITASQELRSNLRKVVAGLLVLIAVNAAIVADAQITPGPLPTPMPINLNPPRPQITAPVGVQAVDPSQNTNVVVRWYQPVLTTTLPTVDASYFVVCLQDGTMTCTYGLSATGVWSGAAVGPTFSRSPVYSGSPFTTTPRILRGYNYSFTATLDSGFYNRFMLLKVGACASTSVISCTYAIPLSVGFSSVDLIAESTGSVSNSTTEEHFYGSARNQGASDSGQVQSFLKVWQVELTQAGPGFPWQCQTDPNATGLHLLDDDRLITSTGGKIRVATRRNTAGSIDVSGLNIVGIHRAIVHEEHDVAGQPLSIPHNATVGVVSADFSVNRPVGIALILEVDNAPLIPEVDKANNNHADCDVIQ